MSGQPSTSESSFFDSGSEWKISKSIFKKSKKWKKSKINFSNLPEDVLLAVFRNCRNPKDVLSVRSVNRRLGFVVERNAYVLQRPKINGIVISVNQLKIPISELGRLRIKKDDSKFFQISLFKNNKNVPLNFTESTSGSPFSDPLSKVLKRFVISEEIVFRNISITNCLLSAFLKPFCDVSTVSRVSFISCTFEDLDSDVFRSLLQKTTCRDLSVEYCFGAEHLIADSLFGSTVELRKFILMPVPGQKFPKLTDEGLKELSFLETLYMPNCLTGFSVSGINEFLKTQKSRDSESSAFTVSADLGQIQSHPLDVKKFASIHLYSLRAQPSVADESVLFFSSSPSIQSTFVPQNTPYGQIKPFKNQKFQVEFKLNSDAQISLLHSPDSPKCMNPFLFVAQVAGGLLKSFPTEQVQSIS